MNYLSCLYFFIFLLQSVIYFTSPRKQVLWSGIRFSVWDYFWCCIAGKEDWTVYALNTANGAVFLTVISKCQFFGNQLIISRSHSIEISIETFYDPVTFTLDPWPYLHKVPQVSAEMICYGSWVNNCESTSINVGWAVVRCSKIVLLTFRHLHVSLALEVCLCQLTGCLARKKL